MGELRYGHTTLTDFLSDSDKLSDKNGLHCDMQKCTHCSESDFLLDINGYRSHFSV